MAIAEPNETRYARRRPAARTLDVILPLLLGAPLASVASEWVPGAQAPPVSIPSYYGGTAAAYDSSRGRIVVFGDVSNGTWEHDGSGWKRSPAVTPSDLGFREGHAMAYDPARRRVVLYGGSYSLDPTIYLKTWEWDGVAWCEGFTGPPGDRKGHGMAFHQALGRIVLYGGNGADRSTWEYGPTGWQAGATAPAAMAGRGSFAMAYDPQRQLVVIHGGRDDTGQVRGDTWEYGTGGWVAGPSSGPTKSHHAMAYVPGRLVVFGGTGSVDDTWEYDGTSWTQMPAAPAAMSGRADHVMVSLPGRIVLFGGVYLTMQPLEDTWQYDGAWTDVGQPPAGFLVNSGAAAAYDSARDRLVLYGGQGFVASASNQTWEYDGAAWQPGPASPPALGWRIYHSMGFDARRGRVMLFGGDAQGSTTNSDTWEYDGTSWSPAAPPPPGLAPRQLAAMAYDTARQRMVMFGGSESGGGLGDDTWEHDGAGWTQGPTAPAAMGGRVGTQMDYDPTLARCVLYGGIGTVPNERHTWLYDGSSWDQGPLADPGMGDIIWGCMAFSPRLGRSVLALGHDNGNGPTTATWEFDGAAWTPGRAGPSDWFPARELFASGYMDSIDALVVVGGDPSSDTWHYRSCPALAISPPSLPAGAVGAPYAQTLIASGGAPPYTFTVSAGVLPPGLSLSSGGVLAGTPAVSGNFGITVFARDAKACDVAYSYVLAIGGAGPKEDLLAGAGCGFPNPNRFRIFTPDGTLHVDVPAYGAGHWGVNVSGGQLDGAPLAEVLSGPGPGDTLGPQVRGFRRNGTPVGKVNFYAYGTLKNGVVVAAGQVDGDAAFDEVLTGAGPGPVFGPHVRGWNYDNATLTAMAKVSFFAYGTLKYGVNVGSGEVDGDGFSELLTGPGPGTMFGPQVRAFDYDGIRVTSIAKVNFFAFPPLSYGANVAGGDVDLDGYGEIASGQGPGPSFSTRCVGFDYDGTAIASLPGFDVNQSGTELFGARVSLGDVAADAAAELAAGPGPDPAALAVVRPYLYQGGALTPLYAFDAQLGTHGVNPIPLDLGY